MFHLGDALSTVRDVVDETGAVIKSFEFDEYGNLLSSSGTGTTSPKTFVGGLSVNDDTADSGMFNMGHRNYAAGVLGRFISRDPIGHSGNLNLYAYPANPVSFTDHAGLEPRGMTSVEFQTYRDALLLLNRRPEETPSLRLTDYEKVALRSERRRKDRLLYIDSAECNKSDNHAIAVTINKKKTALNSVLFLTTVPGATYKEALVEVPGPLSISETQFLSALALATVLVHEDAHYTCDTEAEAARAGLMFLLHLQAREQNPMRRDLINQAGLFFQDVRDGQTGTTGPQYFSGE